MRCPKCSYISFDMVETCSKCGKDISKAADDLMGTAANVEVPSFLNIDFEAHEEEVEEVEEFADSEPELDFDLGGLEDEDEESGEIELDMGGESEGISLDLDLGDEEEVVQELDLGEEETPELELGSGDEPEFDLGLEAEDSEISLDLGEEPEDEALDIAGLAPEEEPEEELSGDIELSLDEPESASDDIELESYEQPSTGEEPKELEDLEVDGIDFGSLGAPSGDKVVRSVKTGTALDDFDVELGDLLNGKKK